MIKSEKFIALFRGINVSGSNLIRMEVLRKSMTDLGLRDVETYIQSGNLVFSYNQADTKTLETMIIGKVLIDFSLQVKVLVKSFEDLSKAIQENPFIRNAGDSVEGLHLTFMDRNPEDHLLQAILPLKDGDVEAAVVEDRIYLKCPSGYGNIKFTNTFFEKKLKLAATTRNWKTMMKLFQLCEGAQ